MATEQKFLWLTHMHVCTHILYSMHSGNLQHNDLKLLMLTLGKLCGLHVRQVQCNKVMGWKH